MPNFNPFAPPEEDDLVSFLLDALRQRRSPAATAPPPFVPPSPAARPLNAAGTGGVFIGGPSPQQPPAPAFRAPDPYAGFRSELDAIRQAQAGIAPVDPNDPRFALKDVPGMRPLPTPPTRDFGTEGKRGLEGMGLAGLLGLLLGGTEGGLAAAGGYGQGHLRGAENRFAGDVDQWGRQAQGQQYEDAAARTAALDANAVSGDRFQRAALGQQQAQQGVNSRLNFLREGMGIEAMAAEEGRKAERHPIEMEALKWGLDQSRAGAIRDAVMAASQFAGDPATQRVMADRTLKAAGLPTIGTYLGRDPATGKKTYFTIPLNASDAATLQNQEFQRGMQMLSLQLNQRQQGVENTFRAADQSLRVQGMNQDVAAARQGRVDSAYQRRLGTWEKQVGQVEEQIAAVKEAIPILEEQMQAALTAQKAYYEDPNNKIGNQYRDTRTSTPQWRHFDALKKQTATIEAKLKKALRDMDALPARLQRLQKQKPKAPSFNVPSVRTPPLPFDSAGGASGSVRAFIGRQSHELGCATAVCGILKGIGIPDGHFPRTANAGKMEEWLAGSRLWQPVPVGEAQEGDVVVWRGFGPSKRHVEVAAGGGRTVGNPGKSSGYRVVEGSIPAKDPTARAFRYIGPGVGVKETTRPAARQKRDKQTGRWMEGFERPGVRFREKKLVADYQTDEETGLRYRIVG